MGNKMKTYKKILKNFKVDKNILILIVAVTIMLSVLFCHGTLNGHDTYTHLFRLEGMTQNVKDFQIPSKIHYNSINGFGYGSGIFYPQFPLYFPTIVHLTGINASLSLKLGIYLSTLLSAVFMYQFLKYKTSNVNASLIASLLYILSPYCFVQSIFRGAIGETFGFLTLPLIFYGIDLILDGYKSKKGEIYLTIGASILLLSHIISTVYTCLFIVIYLLINIKKIFNKKVLYSFLKCLLLILGITCFFTVPLIEHRIIGNYNMFNYTYNPSFSVVYLVQLIFSSGVNAGDLTGITISNELPYTISLLIICVLFSLPYAYKKIKINDNNKRVMSYFVLGILSIFMMICPKIWDKIELLDLIQFPWRLLMFTVFFLTIVCSFVIKNLAVYDKIFPIVLVCVLILSFLQLNPYVISAPIETGFDESILKFQIIDNYNTYYNKALGGANDYLPIEATNTYIQNRGSELVELSGKINTSEQWIKKGNQFYTFVDVNSNTDIELPLIYYLGYTVKSNKKVINNYRDSNGFLAINIEQEGNYQLEIEYTGTILGKISNFISLISILIISLKILVAKKFIRKLYK